MGNRFRFDYVKIQKLNDAGDVSDAEAKPSYGYLLGDDFDCFYDCGYDTFEDLAGTPGEPGGIRKGTILRFMRRITDHPWDVQVAEDGMFFNGSFIPGDELKKLQEKYEDEEL